MQENPPDYYVQSGKAKLKNVGTDKALYVGEQKAVHVLNPTAYLIYEAMRDPITFEELVLVIREVTGEEEDVVAGDLKETLDLFLKYDFIKKAE